MYVYWNVVKIGSFQGTFLEKGLSRPDITKVWPKYAILKWSLNDEFINSAVFQHEGASCPLLQRKKGKIKFALLFIRAFPSATLTSYFLRTLTVIQPGTSTRWLIVPQTFSGDIKWLKHFLLNQPRSSFTSYRFNGAVVELVEHETLDLVIPGSNPARRGYLCSSRVKQWTPGQTDTVYSLLPSCLSE